MVSTSAPPYSPHPSLRRALLVASLLLLPGAVAGCLQEEARPLAAQNYEYWERTGEFVLGGAKHGPTYVAFGETATFVVREGAFRLAAEPRSLDATFLVVGPGEIRWKADGPLEIEDPAAGTYRIELAYETATVQRISVWTLY